MHNIYRTDKLLTVMGENDVICIAQINKWNPISRLDKLRMPVNQSISLIYLRFIRLPTADLNCSDSQLELRSLRHHLWTCLHRSGGFSRWQRRTMPLLFAMQVSKDFERRGKRCQVLTKQILCLTCRGVRYDVLIADDKMSPQSAFEDIL